MNIAFKVIIIAFCGVIIFAIFKSVSSPYAAIVPVVCAVCALLLILPYMRELAKHIYDIFPVSAASSQSIGIFFKCVLICEICTLTKGFCKDSSNGFLALCVDLAEKTAVIITAMPLIESVMKIIVYYIGE